MPEGNFYNAPARPDPANVNAPRDYDANTYLHELCQRGAPAHLIREAVAMGAQINALNKNSLPPLGLAIAGGHVETARAMIEAGAELYFPVETGPRANFEGRGASFFNAVYLAADGGSREMLDLVLKKGGGAFVNCPGIGVYGYDDKWHALHIAVKRWKTDLIPLLLDAGAFVDEEAGASKETPLMLAVSNDSGEAVARLLRQGAALEHRHSASGDTPLLHACRNDKRSAGESLLKFGADAQAANNEGRTPLMLAAKQGSLKLVEEILKQNPDVNARGQNRETALMLAAEGGYSEIVTLLLKKGADPLLADAFNKSARNYADNAPQRNSYGRRYNNGFDDGYYDEYGYNGRGYDGRSSSSSSSNSGSVRLILEEAEKAALQKQFEASYNKLKKPPAAPGA